MFEQAFMENYKGLKGATFNGVENGGLLTIPGSNPMNPSSNRPASPVGLGTMSSISKLSNSKAQPNERTELAGNLFKYSPSLFSSWQERYVTLKDKKLKYFKTK